MTDTKVNDSAEVSLTSTVFPSAADKALWQSLTEAQRQAIIEKQEQDAFASGPSDQSDLQTLLNEVNII